MTTGLMTQVWLFSCDDNRCDDSRWDDNSCDNNSCDGNSCDNNKCRTSRSGTNEPKSKPEQLNARLAYLSRPVIQMWLQQTCLILFMCLTSKSASWMNQRENQKELASCIDTSKSNVTKPDVQCVSCARWRRSHIQKFNQCTQIRAICDLCSMKPLQGLTRTVDNSWWVCQLICLPLFCFGSTV